MGIHVHRAREAAWRIVDDELRGDQRSADPRTECDGEFPALAVSGRPRWNITVDRSEQQYTINVSLYYTEDGVRHPAVGERVVAEFLMPIYGSLQSYESTVDKNGQASFTYVSPKKINSLSDVNVTFYYKKDFHVSGQTTLHFAPASVPTVAHLYVVPSSMTITRGEEERNVTIVTVNSENVGVSAEVSIEQPNNGTDYGYFEPGGPVRTDSSGRAVVVYHAPDSIGGLEDRNITFSLVDDASKSRELTLHYSEVTSQSQYDITVETPESFAVDQQDQLTVIIHRRGNKGDVIDDGDVQDVNLSSLFPAMLTFEQGSDSYTYDQKGTKAVPVQTHTISGTAIVEVNATVFNGTAYETISKQVPVVILSGPVASMSLFYASTTCDAETGILKNIYTIHAVDKYDNPARAGLALHPSLINGVKIQHARSQSGTIEDQSGTTQFTGDVTDNFDDPNHNGNTEDAIAPGTDILAVIPNASKYDKSYLGNWSISSVDSTNTLSLVEAYGGAKENNLSFIIGNSNRYIDGYGIATADIESKDGGYLTDENGNMQFVVNFDPVLAGHTVTISANTYEDVNRTGVAIVAGLRWGGYTSSQETIKNDGNTHLVSLSLGISGCGGGGTIAALSGVTIPESAIVIDSSQCEVDNTVPGHDMTADSNGVITVGIKTAGSDPDVKECSVNWNASNSGIYLEY